jgi:hypothetical protein
MAKKISKSATNRKSSSASGGPYLQAAAFCEKVLRESDNVFSIIRMVDLVTVNGPTDKMTPGKISLTFAIAFRGTQRSTGHEVVVQMRGPDGKKSPELRTTIEIGDDNKKGVDAGGAFLEMEATLLVNKPGLYMADVRLDGKLITRMPLTIRYQRVTKKTSKSGE